MMTKEQKLAAEAFADVWSEVLPNLPDDYQCHMTCIEAESAAEFMRAFGRFGVANSILRAHAEHDDAGDSRHEWDPT